MANKEKMGTGEQGSHITSILIGGEEQNYKEKLKRFQVHIGTLLKTDNLSFLIGAGASMGCGGVSLGRIPLEVEKHLIEQGFKGGTPMPWFRLFYRLTDLLTGFCTKDEDIMKRKEAILAKQKDEKAGLVESLNINLEEFLSYLHLIYATMRGDFLNVTLTGKYNTEVSKEDLKTLIAHLTKGLALACQLPKKGSDDIKYHRQMIKKVLTRPLNLKRANIFTLNYDTLLEQACDAEGVVVIDGFVGTLQRVFRPESFDQDLYFPAQTTEGRVHRLDRVIHLYKLHGSLTWHRTEVSLNNPYGVHATYHDNDINSDSILIYPTPLKYGQALGLPYSELFRRFAAAVVQPQSVLIVIGYGFGDEHVNAIIRQALAIPSFTLIIVDPSPTNDFVKKLKEQKDKRVWIVKGKFKEFVEHLLPNLEEEVILKKVTETYNAIHMEQRGDQGEE